MPEPGLEVTPARPARRTPSPASPKLEDPSDFLQPLMTVEDVAQLLKVKSSTVRAYAERGSLPCVRLGNRLRFRPSDVGLWIARRYERRNV